MIYVTGDTHGEKSRFFGEHTDDKEFTKDDCLIICGDFGFIFEGGAEEKTVLDELEKKPYTIAFCDGNHENFPCLYSYPEEEWNGGRVHRIRKNIFHLMRGQVFETEGKKIFTMGGAYSIDKYRRCDNIDWWKEEMPTDEEYKEAAKNLEKHGMSVDYIITHTAPTEVKRSMGYGNDMHEAELSGFLEWIMHEVSFEKWYFGHFHIEEKIYEKFRALYYDTVKAGED